MAAGDTGVRPDTGDDSLTWQRPSPRLLRARRIQVAVGTVPVAAIGGLIGGAAGTPLIGLIVALALLAVGLAGEWFVGRRVAAWAYAEREDDLMVRRGGMIRRQSVVPYGRMQFIDVTAGPVEC